MSGWGDTFAKVLHRRSGGELEWLPTTRSMQAAGVDTSRAEGPLPLRIAPRRGAAYVVTDATGAEVGKILGDYVLGFTAYCFGQSWLCSTLEEAESAIAAAYAAGRGMSVA